MEDILEAVGFHPRNGLPVFKFSARKKYAKRKAFLTIKLIYPQLGNPTLCL